MNKHSPWNRFEAITRPALIAAPQTFLANIRENLTREDIPEAVADHDTLWIFNWMVGIIQFQGISDRNAAAFTAKHGIVGWGDIAGSLKPNLPCPRLHSFWHFHRCGYRKATAACAEPQHISACPLPLQPARKGSLIQAAYALFLFIRDVCDGDLIDWIDGRLADADPGGNACDRAVSMGTALLEPLRNIYGIGDKVWSMTLADLLLAADPNRERWVTTGAGMIVVDTLLHNHFHRTGVLRRFCAEHPYGPRCYAPGGCADLVRGLAQRIDTRQFNPNFPACFPRFVQFAIWRLCSTSELDICNGNRIDDRDRCRNVECPAFSSCDRLPLRDASTPTQEQAKHY